MVDMKPMPDAEKKEEEILDEMQEEDIFLKEKIKQDLQQEDTTNDELDNSFIGSDMDDSLEDGVPGYQAEGESGKLVGEGVPGFQTTGESQPNNEIQNQADEEIEEEESAPTPSPFNE